jgi:ABC-type antimicrobial peptide transport system ATPase subunit
MLANFAKNLMAGKKTSSIQKTTRCKSARLRVAKNSTALTTIPKMKNEHPCPNFSSSFLSAGRSTFLALEAQVAQINPHKNYTAALALAMAHN